MCVSHVCGCLRKPEEGVRSWSWIAGGYELSRVGAGNPAGRTVSVHICQTISPASGELFVCSGYDYSFLFFFLFNGTRVQSFNLVLKSLKQKLLENILLSLKFLVQISRPPTEGMPMLQVRRMVEHEKWNNRTVFSWAIEPTLDNWG